MAGDHLTDIVTITIVDDDATVASASATVALSEAPVGLELSPSNPVQVGSPGPPWSRRLAGARWAAPAPTWSAKP